MVSLFRYPKRQLKKLVKNGEYIEALEYGKSIEKEFSEDHDYLFIMGSIFYILEDSKKAIPYFDKALAYQGDDIEALMLKTNSHLALEQKDDAIHTCKQILKINPDHNEALMLLDKLESI